jgi:hypothetical protein
MKHLMQSDIVFVTLALIVTIAALIFAFMVIAALVTLLGNLAHDTGKTGMGSSCAYLQDCYAPAGDLAYWDRYGGVAVSVRLVANRRRCEIITAASSFTLY